MKKIYDEDDLDIEEPEGEDLVDVLENSINYFDQGILQVRPDTQWSFDVRIRRYKIVST